jgi:zinc transport system substrate-binding protein
VAYFSQEVGGAHVKVTNITPAGVEPHDFEPTPQDIARIEQATVFVYNGAGFEPWINRILPDLQRAGVTVVDASRGISLMKGETEEGSGEPSAGGHLDPHIWLDPITAKQMVATIAEGLVAADPVNRSSYRMNAERLSNMLSALDTEFRTGLGTCERREFVTSHAAFAYLAKTYDLTQVSITGISPDEEPSPQKLAEVATFAKQKGVKYIFFETLVSPRLAETIANEVGAQTLVLNPIEGLTDEEIAAGNNYLTIQRDNLKNLRRALDCS